MKPATLADTRAETPLSQDIRKLPFDLQSYNAKRYSRDFAQVRKLGDSLAEIARGLKDASTTFGNPMSDFAPDAVVSTQRPSPEE